MLKTRITLGNISLVLLNLIKNFIFVIFKTPSLNVHVVKGALSGPRQVLATKSPFKMMKNVSYFTSKALFVLEIFKFLS